MSLRCLWRGEARHLGKRYFRILNMVLFCAWVWTGNVQAESIESLEPINLGQVKQWIYVTGKNTGKPVLLILHGGPGEAILPMFHHFNRELEKYFIVVTWDQRGAGKSYSKSISPKTMTLQQFVSDAHELTTKLKKRFKQRKIYILAHSSGTMIAIPLIKKYPNDYYAYIGVGQVISFAKNEIGSYNYALQKARATNNKEALQELENVGKPDAAGNYNDDSGYDITSKWIENFGAEIHDPEKCSNYDTFIYTSDIYKSKIETAKRKQGIIFSDKLFDDPHMKKFDANQLAPEISVPVYFISGKYDHDTPIELVKKYYAEVKSPHKAFIEFDHSAHNPFYEEPEHFDQVLIDRVLAETYQQKIRG